MGVLVRHWLHVDPADDLDELVEQHAEALWLEERFARTMQGSVAKAFGAK